MDLSENSVVQVGKDAIRHHPNTTAGVERTNLTIKTLFLDDNLLGDLDFLVDPCSLLVGNQSFIAVRNNPIRCDCFLYNLTRLRVVEVHGTCASPNRFFGASLDGYINTNFKNLLEQTKDTVVDQASGISSFAPKFGGPSAAGAPRRRPRPGSFLQEAETECSGTGTDELLHKQYICTCRKWKPYIQTATFHPLGPQVAAQVQLCSKATCHAISFWNLLSGLLFAIILKSTFNLCK